MLKTTKQNENAILIGWLTWMCRGIYLSCKDLSGSNIVFQRLSQSRKNAVCICISSSSSEKSRDFYSVKFRQVINIQVNVTCQLLLISKSFAYLYTVNSLPIMSIVLYSLTTIIVAHHYILNSKLQLELFPCLLYDKFKYHILPLHIEYTIEHHDITYYFDISHVPAFATRFINNVTRLLIQQHSNINCSLIYKIYYSSPVMSVVHIHVCLHKIGKISEKCKKYKDVNVVLSSNSIVYAWSHQQPENTNCHEATIISHYNFVIKVKISQQSNFI